jgi:flagellar biosynthesis/type III secretory pathway protein FliH
LFAGLAGRVIRMAEGAPPDLQVSENLLEVRTMLATRAAEWKQQWLLEGEQKGRLEGEQKGRLEGEQKGRLEGEQKGRVEGEQKGEAKVLLRLLERRFGSVPDAMKDRIAAADVSELDTWIMRVLDAGSIEDVMS